MTREIRKREETIHQPYISELTAHALTQQKEDCLQAGMNEFLTKPITPDAIKRMIENMSRESSA